MDTLASTTMAVAMIAAMLLACGAIVLLRSPDTRFKGVLMLVMAAVLVVNVMIWTV